MASPPAPFEVSLSFRPCPPYETSANWSRCVAKSKIYHSLSFNTNMKMADWQSLLAVSNLRPGSTLRFYRIFEDSSPTSQIFRQSCAHQVDHVLNGYNATILMFGADFAGSASTLFGNASEIGIAQQAVNHILSQRRRDREVRVKMRFFKILSNRITDLLAKDEVALRMRQTHVEGLTSIKVTSLESFQAAIRTGLSQAVNGHLILKMTVETRILDYQSNPRLVSSVLTFASLDSQSARDLNEFKGVINSMSQAQLAVPQGSRQERPAQFSRVCRLLLPALQGEEYVSCLCSIDSAASKMQEACSTLSLGLKVQQMTVRVRQNASISESDALQVYKQHVENLERKILLQISHSTDLERKMQQYLQLYQPQQKIEEEPESCSQGNKLMDAQLLKLRNENRLLRCVLKMAKQQEQEVKLLQDQESISFSLTSSLHSQPSSHASASTQTQDNEYTIFGQVMRYLMDKFPELKQRIIRPAEFKRLFLIFNKMQSDLVQEIHKNAGFPTYSNTEYENSASLSNPYSKPRDSLGTLDEIIEKSDIVSSDNFLVLSRETESILSTGSKKDLQQMMNFDLNRPLDTQKMKDFIQKQTDSRPFTLLERAKSIRSSITSMESLNDEKDIGEAGFLPELKIAPEPSAGLYESLAPESFKPIKTKKQETIEKPGKIILPVLARRGQSLGAALKDKNYSALGSKQDTLISSTYDLNLQKVFGKQSSQSSRVYSVLKKPSPRPKHKKTLKGKSNSVVINPPGTTPRTPQQQPPQDQVKMKNGQLTLTKMKLNVRQSVLVSKHNSPLRSSKKPKLPADQSSSYLSTPKKKLFSKALKTTDKKWDDISERSPRFSRNPRKVLASSKQTSKSRLSSAGKLALNHKNPYLGSLWG